MRRHPNHELMRQLETEYEGLEFELLSLRDMEACLEEGYEGELLKCMEEIQSQIAWLAHHGKADSLNQ